MTAVEVDNKRTPPAKTPEQDTAATSSASEHDARREDAARPVAPVARKEPAKGERSVLAVPGRPRVLASEALRDDIAPHAPAGDAIRVFSVPFGLAGTAATLFLLGLQGVGTPLAGAFVGIALLGVSPIPYAARAAAVLTISASALGLVTWVQLGSMGNRATVLETVAVVLLAGALLLRAWHRSSVLARVLVLVGMGLGGGWLGMSGALDSFAIVDPAWQSWLPIAWRAPFALLLMLSLLAFMDARTTGASGFWAACVLSWYAVHMAVRLMTASWPPDAAAPSWLHIGADAVAALVASPMLAVLVAIAMAQLLAVILANLARP